LPPGLLPAGATPPAVIVRQAEFGVVNGTLRLPLDLSGELQHTLAAAQAGYRGERARLWATRLAEQVRVIRAYFQLLEAERLAEVTEQTIATDRQQRANAEQRFAAGRLTKNELLVVQVALRNAEEQRLQRALAIDQARWALNQAVGLPVDAPTAVVDVRERPAVPEADEALRLARATNPVLASLLEEQQRLEESARALARSRLFDAGRATSDDVLDAEALLAGQRATRAGALYQAHTRRAELQELLGLPLDAVVGETR